MSARIRAHLRANVVGYVALFLVVTGGTAQALGGHNTVFSDDIVNGQVKTGDMAAKGVTRGRLAADAVNSPKLLGGAVKVSDLGANAVTSDKILDQSITHFDIGHDAVGASEIGDSIFDEPDQTPNLISGGIAENGAYNVGSSVASCHGGEELVGGYGRWLPDDNASTDAELFISEVRLDHGAEQVTVDGGNDSGVGYRLQAVATCLQAEF